MSRTPARMQGLAKRLAQRKFLITGHLQQHEGLQERPSTTLTRAASTHAESGAMDAVIAKSLLQSGRVISPVPGHGEGKSLENTSC